MSTLTIKEIAWVAGILEGEATFGLTNNGNSPAIWLGMTDVDIVERIRNIVDKTLRITISEDNRKESYKTMYKVSINGQRAVGWMMTIYSFMSHRRKARILECLSAWKAHVPDLSQLRSRDSHIVQGINFSKNYTLKGMGFTKEQIKVASTLRNSGIPEEEIINILGNIKS